MPLNLSKTQLIVIASAGLAILLFALIFSGVIPGLRRPPSGGGAAKLEIWGVLPDEQVLRDLTGGIADVSYRQFDIETYEAKLLEALASDRGPDIFMAHNTWLPKHFERMVPVASALGPETFPLVRLRELFPTVVEQNFAPDGLLYALPLSVDTLALLYNRDLFDSAGIAIPPKTWTEFRETIPDLRIVDREGRLARAAFAIGGSAKSINRATDLLGIIMLQSGVAMVNNTFTRATFSAGNGESAFRFYLNFANSGDPAYTWNENFDYSIDAFGNETAAGIFNYAYQLPFLRERNPFLKIGVAPLPQPTAAQKDISYANYWGYAVSRKSRNQGAAWNFILRLTTDAGKARAYLDRTARPPALRALIQEKLNDPDIGVFAKQALSARSWPQIDERLVESALSDAIAEALSGRPLKDAIEKAENRVTQKMSETR